MAEPKRKRRSPPPRAQREADIAAAFQIGKEAGERAAGASFTADELRKILALVHPDKHGGSALATEVAARVSAARDVLAEGS